MKKQEAHDFSRGSITHNRIYLQISFVLVLLFLCSWNLQQTVSEQHELPADDLIITKAKASTVRITGGNLSRIWAGSGFFVQPDKIVTNLHVVTQSGLIFAKQEGHAKVWTVEGVTAFDRKNDLVILKVSSEGIPLPLADSDAVKKGDSVYASSYPGGKEYKLTEGKVHRFRPEERVMLTTAEISSGSSGGPMLNSAAEIIGIGFAVGDTYSFAIPSNILKALLSQEGETQPLMQWYQQDSVRAYRIYHQGFARYGENDYNGAITDFSQAIQLDPKFASAYHFRGHAYSYHGETEAEQGRMTKSRKYFQDSIADYTEAIKLEPEEDTAYNYRGHVQSHYGEAEVDLQNYTAAQERYQAAIIDYDQALKIDPENDRNYAGRGWTLYLLGETYAKEKNDSEALIRYQEAIDDYDQAIKLHPEESTNYNNRGWVKYLIGQLNTTQGNDAEAKQHYQDAITDSDKAIELDSEEGHFYHTRGAAKAALDDYSRAIEDFDTALKHKPDYKDAYEDRGKAKEALGQHDAAKADFTKAMQSIGQGSVSTKEIEKAEEEMVLIPAGEFQMGSQQANNASPIHTVYLDEFYIDAYEVTNAQFKAFIDANPEWSKTRIPRKYHNGRYLRFWDGDNYPEGKGNHPVVYVSWYAAMAYAKWADKRLPTEAEWEKAARGGETGQRYVWGDLRDPKKSNYGYYDTNTLPVGSYLPNGYGLYDMGGNVWELCLDQYEKNFYRRSPKNNPIAGDANIQELVENFTSITTHRVSRGGSWNTPSPAQTADRSRYMPTNTNGWLGFRCARSIPTE